MSNVDQKRAFLREEGDAFFERNRAALTRDERLAGADPVLKLVSEWKPFPSRVLEIGCANGWRLNRLRALGAVQLHGIDPAPAAVAAGRSAFPEVSLEVGTADQLPFPNDSFDLVVFGFCLYLCDPADHFRIVAEADRVLGSPGQLCLLDFDPLVPYRNPYAHKPGLYSYKMDFSSLFLAHPHYQLREKRVTSHDGGAPACPDDRIAITWLTKDSRTGWPENPWRGTER